MFVYTIEHILAAVVIVGILAFMLCSVLSIKYKAWKSRRRARRDDPKRVNFTNIQDRKGPVERNGVVDNSHLSVGDLPDEPFEVRGGFNKPFVTKTFTRNPKGVPAPDRQRVNDEDILGVRMVVAHSAFGSVNDNGRIYPVPDETMIREQGRYQEDWPQFAETPVPGQKSAEPTTPTEHKSTTYKKSEDNDDSRANDIRRGDSHRHSVHSSSGDETAQGRWVGDEPGRQGAWGSNHHSPTESRDDSPSSFSSDSSGSCTD